MPFENWEKFLHDTIEELNYDSNIEERMNTERTRSQQRRKTRRGEPSPEGIKARPVLQRYTE